MLSEEYERKMRINEEKEEATPECKITMEHRRKNKEKIEENRMLSHMLRKKIRRREKGCMNIWIKDKAQLELLDAEKTYVSKKGKQE